MVHDMDIVDDWFSGHHMIVAFLREFKSHAKVTGFLFRDICFRKLKRHILYIYKVEINK